MGNSPQFCYIYLIGPEGGRGPLKVGISTRPEHRAKQLQTAYPRPVAVYGSWPHADPRAVEAETHRLLAPWHINGEWFDVNQDRATAAIVQAISRVNSNSLSDMRYTLDSMRDVIMPVIMLNAAEKDQHRIGYARHVSGIDLACQISWLQAYSILDHAIYVETEPKTNSILRKAYRELRPGDHFFVLSKRVLGGEDQMQTLLKIAKERDVTIQFVDEVVSYAD
jgi:hypothetical protein